jgi:hypothetical protein
MMRCWMWFVVLLLALLMLGCKPDVKPVDVGDGGLLKHEACELPCFLGIKPGATSLTEALTTLERKSVGSHCSDPDSYSRIICRDVAAVGVNPKTHLVSWIGFNPTTPITLGDVISLYGEPSAVLVIPDGVPEHPYTNMMVFFDNIRTRIVLIRKEGTVYKVDSSLGFDNVVYYDMDAYKEDKQHVTNWTGYGVYPQTPIR